MFIDSDTGQPAGPVRTRVMGAPHSGFSWPYPPHTPRQVRKKSPYDSWQPYLFCVSFVLVATGYLSLWVHELQPEAPMDRGQHLAAVHQEWNLLND